MDKTGPSSSPQAGAISRDIVDMRGLEAPEPMVKILTACTKLEHGECFKAHLPHIPFPLLPHLESRGFAWETEELPDGSAIIRIRIAP